MSSLINFIVKNSISCSSRRLVSLRSISTSPANFLYSHSALGIDGYLQGRKNVKDQFANFSDKFKSKMLDFVNDPKTMIFTEDLKNMAYIAEPSDLELVIKMINKFNASNTEYRFGSFVFGPVIMRMYYFLDAPNEALQCFEDPINNGFFDQLISYQILLDLLYNHEMYDEMYRVFETVKEKQINMTKYPKYPIVLILAACYKQNTPQSMEYASKLWSDMTSVGSVPLRRSSCFLAALALQQKKPHVALESISVQKTSYVTTRNIRAMALADLGRVEDAMMVVRTVLDIDMPEQKDKHTVFEETVVRVREAAEKTQDQSIIKQFLNIEKELKNRGLIDKQTLDQLLTSDISIKSKTDTQRGMPSQKRFPYAHRQRKSY